jgi:hypothetical protein
MALQTPIPARRPWSDDFSNLPHPLLKKLEQDDD